MVVTAYPRGARGDGSGAGVYEASDSRSVVVASEHADLDG